MGPPGPGAVVCSPSAALHTPKAPEASPDPAKSALPPVGQEVTWESRLWADPSALSYKMTPALEGHKRDGELMAPDLRPGVGL